MIKGFSIKNMLIGLLIGTLVATNFHTTGLSAVDMTAYIAVASGVAWAAVEELEIRHDQRRKKRDI